MRRLILIAPLLAGCAGNTPNFGEPQALSSSKPFTQARDCVLDSLMSNISHVYQMGTPERAIFLEQVYGVTYSRVEVHPDGAKSRIIVHSYGLSVPRVIGYVQPCL